MLSVKQAAKELGISESRVRKLISDKKLPAKKIGARWILDERDVARRKFASPSSGRPTKPKYIVEDKEDLEFYPYSNEAAARESVKKKQALYRACKETFLGIPPISDLVFAETKEEADFYAAINDFFLRQRQREVIAKGLF